MNIVGLITEYNPFHNGHLHHIKEAKRITGADAVLVIISQTLYSGALRRSCQSIYGQKPP